MDKDFNNMPPYMDYASFQQNINSGNFQDSNELYRDQMFNPMSQYEQAYLYYRYMCMQMDYRIKCKEYEKMCNTRNESNEKSQRRVE